MAQSVLVFKLFFILGGLLDLFLMMYFLCTAKFNRMEFFIMYGFHIIFTGFAFIVSLIQSFSGNDCMMKTPFLGTTVSLSIVFIVSAFFVMWRNLYFVLKFAHLGCNIVWTIFWLQFVQCGHAIASVIGVIHAILSLVGLISFIILSIMKKTTTTAKCWRQLYIISIILMIVCYAISFVGKLFSGDCQAVKLFFLTY